MAAGGEELEVCCVCLDSLSAAPVAALLDGGAACRARCPHFLHAGCAERLWPTRCPLCRAPFAALSAPISGRRLQGAGASEVLAGLRRLAGRAPEAAAPEPVTVPAHSVVQLLAAILPVTRDSLLALVFEQLAQRGGGQEAELGEEDLARLLRQLGLQGAASATPVRGGPPSPAALPKGYSLSTRVSRRLKRLLLQLAGAAGASIHAACCGVLLGMLVGSLAALPRIRAWDLSDVLDRLAHEPNALSLVAIILGMMVVQLAWHSCKDPRWVRLCGRCGAAAGALLGWLHALVTVDPDDHGFLSVFRVGLSGRTMWPEGWAPLGGGTFAPRGRHGRGRAPRHVDVFSPACGGRGAAGSAGAGDG